MQELEGKGLTHLNGGSCYLNTWGLCATERSFNICVMSSEDLRRSCSRARCEGQKTVCRCTLNGHAVIEMSCFQSGSDTEILFNSA